MINNNNIFKISDVLKYIVLFIDINKIDRDKKEELNKLNIVKLMTIHTAKNLIMFLL